MPAYAFEALHPDGQSRKGTLEADTAKAARSQLRSQGLVPLQVQAVAAGTQAASRWSRRVFGGSALAVWTRQLAGLSARACPWSVRSPR